MAYAVIMLNVDQHNKNVKQQKSMTVEVCEFFEGTMTQLYYLFFSAINVISFITELKFTFKRVGKLCFYPECVKKKLDL